MFFLLLEQQSGIEIHWMFIMFIIMRINWDKFLHEGYEDLFCSGRLETEVEDGDTVVFISTLHGG